jgi:hypothetical protein
MLRFLAGCRIPAMRMALAVVLATAAFAGSGVRAEAAHGRGPCGEHGFAVACCCADCADPCPDTGAAGCAARCLVGCAAPIAFLPAAPSSTAIARPSFALTQARAPAAPISAPLTPPPIVRL